MYDYVIFASYGNDSIALIQYIATTVKTHRSVAVVYSNTGWAAPWWEERVTRGELLAAQYGFATHQTASEGMVALVKRKSGWPMGGGAAFCTAELKVLPGLKWLTEHDPEKEAVVCTGVRRVESANRATAPEWTLESPRHDGRELWQPLVRHTDAMRDELIIAAGFEVLPHRSMECYPCVHANIGDLRALDEDRIALIDVTEQEMGINSKGNPRVMFRPKRHKGAVGIRAVHAWALKPRPRDLKKEQDAPCSSGWCGM